MGDAATHLSSGDCGLRWTAPSGTIVQHSEHELIVRDDQRLIWHVTISPRPFGAADGEDAALAEDIEVSARDAFDAQWRDKPDRAPGEQPRTADPAWSPVVEAALVTAGGGRCARVIRRLTCEPGDDIVAGHVIAAVARGTVELRIVARDLPDGVGAVRAAIDRTLRELAITKPATRQRFATLPDAGCAFVPPPRYVAVEVKLVRGMYMFWRAGLDGWRRLLDVWRVGKAATRDGDRGPGLAAVADRMVRDWEREGATDIELETLPIADFGGAIQIEQHVRFRAGGEPSHTVHRWWIDASDMIYRIGCNAPPSTSRAVLAADLDLVQKTWRTL